MEMLVLFFPVTRAIDIPVQNIKVSYVSKPLTQRLALPRLCSAFMEIGFAARLAAGSRNNCLDTWPRCARDYPEVPTCSP